MQNNYSEGVYPMNKNTEILSVIKELEQVGGEVLALEKGYRFLSRNKVERLIFLLQAVLFPKILSSLDSNEMLIFEIAELLTDLTGKKKITLDFIKMLPKIKEQLLTDAIAICDGDPAAHSLTEIILAYPGFYATLVHRLSHELFLMGVAYLPRLMSEIAHSKTGVDIHPGAEIEESFCIDHGTGVVIGETARIGKRVKIYQGVTIGAKSFEIGENGELIKGRKRHPDIGAGCVIYANATILGGDTVIGEDCVIGGNVWLTHSIPAGSKIYYNKK